MIFKIGDYVIHKTELHGPTKARIVDVNDGITVEILDGSYGWTSGAYKSNHSGRFWSTSETKLTLLKPLKILKYKDLL